MIFQHLNETPVPPCERNRAIPEIVSDMCMWMLAKDPAERPQNYDELRQAFDAIMGKD